MHGGSHVFASGQLIPRDEIPCTQLRGGIGGIHPLRAFPLQRKLHLPQLAAE